jgi:hypothetical protein
LCDIIKLFVDFVYKKNQMSTDRESGRGNKRARVTRGSRKLFVDGTDSTQKFYHEWANIDAPPIFCPYVCLPSLWI